MALTDAKRRANNKYIAEHTTVLGCKVRKDYAEVIRIAAQRGGTTVNAIIKGALDDYISGASKPRAATDTQDAPGLHLTHDAQQIAEQAATAAGETLEQYVSRAAITQAERDTRSRALGKL